MLYFIITSQIYVFHEFDGSNTLKTSLNGGNKRLGKQWNAEKTLGIRLEHSTGREVHWEQVIAS